jgi:hypothetical protein
VRPTGDGDGGDVVDTAQLIASVDLVGHEDEEWDAEEALRVLASRPVRPDIRPDPALPADTRLWARLQSVSGGLWGGCVYDADEVERRLAAP